MATEEQVVEPAAAPTQVNVAKTNIEPARVPQYRRDVFPRNLVLSADDIREFCELLHEANQRAKTLEYNAFDLSRVESPDEARERVNEFMPLEYRYMANTGDSVQGLGIPRTDEYSFPEDLKSVFISNASYAKRVIDVYPLNAVDAFFSFARPTLKLDLQTLPSNPTENRSVINVSGRDEDWVISTTDRIQSFLKRRRAFRPIIHGSGAYDYFIFLAFIPAAIWLFYKNGGSIEEWLNKQSIFLNVILGLYALLVSLLFARFGFQYFRWLFPPMEYYKRSRIGAFLHRSVAGLVGSAVLLSAAYDLAKALFLGMLGEAG